MPWLSEAKVGLGNAILIIHVERRDISLSILDMGDA